MECRGTAWGAGNGPLCAPSVAQYDEPSLPFRLLADQGLTETRAPVDARPAGSCRLRCPPWEDPAANLRLFGKIRRQSKEWKALYTKRQAIERTFKSLKQSRRLERHCIRGLRQVRLHCLVSVLAYQATVLAQVQAGEMEDMRWQVRRVA